MKKKYIVMLLTVVFMAGCGDVSDLNDTKIIQTEEISSEIESESIAEKPQTNDSLKAYENIIAHTYEFIIADKQEITMTEGLTGIAEACMGAETDEILSRIGYMLYDVDSNGEEELIIAEMGEGYYWANRILSMYSLSEGKPVLVIDGWARNRFYILNDGTIYNEGSGGAAYTTFATYHMAEDGISLSPIDYYFSDYVDASTQEGGWFHNTTGESDVEKSEIVEFEDENEPWQMQEEYEKQIMHLDLTYFSEYEAENVK